MRELLMLSCLVAFASTFTLVDENPDNAASALSRPRRILSLSVGGGMAFEIVHRTMSNPLFSTKTDKWCSRVTTGSSAPQS